MTIFNFQSETVQAFLKSKGWTLESVEGGYIPAKPPIEIKTNKKTRLYIPHQDFAGSKAYQQRMRLVIQSIASLYELDLFEMELLFSKTLDEIKASVSQQQAILGVAS